MFIIHTLIHIHFNLLCIFFLHSCQTEARVLLAIKTDIWKTHIEINTDLRPSLCSLDFISFNCSEIPNY